MTQTSAAHRGDGSWRAVMVRSVSIVCAALASAAATAGLGAQAPLPQFEVASVKPNAGGDGRVMLGFQPGGRFVATNVPLRVLITQAWRIQPFQLLNAPDWVSTERFDINAKADVAPPDMPGVMPQMMRALLAERFGLRTHEETRELPIFALVVAREDRRLGPQLKPSSLDCEAMRREARGRGAAAMPPPPPAPAGGRGAAPGALPCGIRLGAGLISGSGWPLSELAGPLSQMTGRVVVDRTGLSGPYDVELNWTPDTGPGSVPPGALPSATADSGAGASIYTALQEQLGLKLESQRGPVSVLVVDAVARPTPD